MAVVLIPNGKSGGPPYQSTREPWELKDSDYIFDIRRILHDLWQVSKTVGDKSKYV